MSMALYEWLVWAHLVGVFGFLISHGGSSLAVFRIKGTRSPEKLGALLDLSRLSVTISYGFIFLVLVSGVSLGFLGGFWGRIWIWLAIVVALVMPALMYRLGTAHFNSLRRAAGVAYYEKRKKQSPRPVEAAELDRALSSTRPVELSAIGIIGLLAISWLMVFKPF